LDVSAYFSQYFDFIHPKCPTGIPARRPHYTAAPRHAAAASSRLHHPRRHRRRHRTDRPASAAHVRGHGPGPRDLSGRLPIVYNVYTEPAHRRHGLARAIMQAIHAWCLEAGYGTVGLAASDEGRTLYESLGYRESPRPYMFVTLQRLSRDPR